MCINALTTNRFFKGVLQYLHTEQVMYIFHNKNRTFSISVSETELLILFRLVDLLGPFVGSAQWPKAKSAADHRILAHAKLKVISLIWPARTLHGTSCCPLLWLQYKTLPINNNQTFCTMSITVLLSTLWTEFTPRIVLRQFLLIIDRFKSKKINNQLLSWGVKFEILWLPS